ncbi:MAG: hypothetical protein QXI19_02965 [Candidatus Caldarchaeum sp.]
MTSVSLSSERTLGLWGVRFIILLEKIPALAKEEQRKPFDDRRGIS